MQILLLDVDVLFKQLVMEESSMIRNKDRIIDIRHLAIPIMLLFLVSTMLYVGRVSSDGTALLSLEENDELDLYARTIAERLTESPEIFRLEKTYDVTDSQTGNVIRCMSWTLTGTDLMEIRIDLETGMLVSYIDTTSNPTSQYYVSEMSEDIALEMAYAFIEFLSQMDLFSWPSNCVFAGVLDIDSHWTFAWYHIINGIKVVDDSLRIRIDPYTGNVRYLQIQWSNYDSVSPMHIDPDVNSNILSDIICMNDAVIKQSGPFFIKNEKTRQYDLSWKFDVKLDSHLIASTYVSTNTGSVLSIDMTNSFYGEFVLAQGRDGSTGTGNLDTAHTAALDAAKYRLESNNYHMDTWDNRVYLSEMQSYLDNANIIIFEGHGHGGSGVGSWITIYGYDFCGEDIPEDMSQAEIFYTASCEGGWTTQYPQYAYKYIANMALNAGVQAYHGFLGSPYTEAESVYCKYFWAAAVNGKTFATCQAYAGAYVSNSSLGNAPSALYGDRSNALSKEDVSYNKILGFVHIDDHVAWDDEPCWQLDSDQFRFYSYETAYYTIFVDPERSDFDVAFKVYNSNYQLIATVNSQESGGTESYCFCGGSGYYYIKVYATSSMGGVYDLDVYVLS